MDEVETAGAARSAPEALLLCVGADALALEAEKRIVLMRRRRRRPRIATAMPSSSCSAWDEVLRCGARPGVDERRVILVVDDELTRRFCSTT
jgi:hypothetical protein